MWVLERVGWLLVRLSFGTLLGPEATGAGFLVGDGSHFCVACSWVGGLVVGVSGFPGHCCLRPLWGCGWGVTGLLFENCIVDASILLILCSHMTVVAFWVVVCCV